MDVTIIIDGVKHKLVKDRYYPTTVCDLDCSMNGICKYRDGEYLCKQFQDNTHFEIEE